MNYRVGTILARREVEKGQSGQVSLFRVEDIHRGGAGITLRDESGRSEFRTVTPQGMALGWPIEQVLFGYRLATPEEARRFPS